MKNGSDVFGVLAWGLRRYAWLVAAFVLALGVIVPGLLQQTPEKYEATTQVGPTRAVKVPNIDVLPKVGTTVFDNVLDSPEVKAAAGLGPKADLGPENVELVAGQDNLIFAVVGRGGDPATAANVADTAAAQFVEEINQYTESVGSFAVGALATPPSQPLPKIGGPMAWGIGLLSGLAAGVGCVALLLLLRRPVVDIAGAEEAAGVPVVGRITFGGRKGGTQGMTQLCRRILSEPTDLLLLVGPANTRPARHELTSELAGWLGRVRRVIPLGERETVGEYGSASLTSGQVTSGEDLVIISDASPVEVATRPDKSLTLLVVREGISQHELREQAGQYMDGGSAAVVLVRKTPRRAAGGPKPREASPRPSKVAAPQSDAPTTVSTRRD